MGVVTGLEIGPSISQVQCKNENYACKWLAKVLAKKDKFSVIAASTVKNAIL